MPPTCKVFKAEKAYFRTYIPMREGNSYHHGWRHDYVMCQNLFCDGELQLM